MDKKRTFQGMYSTVITVREFRGPENQSLLNFKWALRGWNCTFFLKCRT